MYSDVNSSDEDELEIIDPFLPAESIITDTRCEEQNTVEPVLVELMEAIDTEHIHCAENMAVVNSPVSFGPQDAVDPLDLDDSAT